MGSSLYYITALEEDQRLWLVIASEHAEMILCSTTTPVSGERFEMEIIYGAMCLDGSCRSVAGLCVDPREEKSQVRKEANRV